MKIVADRDVCVGAGMCVRTAPDLFDQDPEDGTVVLLADTVSDPDAEMALEAIDACPSGALSLLREES